MDKHNPEFKKVIQYLLKVAHLEDLDAKQVKRETGISMDSVKSSLLYLRDQNAVQLEEIRSKKGKISNYKIRVLYESLKKYDSGKLINWDNPWHKYVLVPFAILVVGGLLVGLVLAIFNGSENDYPPEEPVIKLDSISLSPSYTSCHDRGNIDLIFKMAHESGKCESFVQSYYYFVNQTGNTCNANVTFFNNTGKLMSLCYVDFYQGNSDFRINTGCFPKADMLCENVLRGEANLNFLQDAFINKMLEINQTSQCEITEQIKVCAISGKHCSDVQTLTLFYTPC